MAWSIQSIIAEAMVFTYCPEIYTYVINNINTGTSYGA
jgi:hypothetical protein